MFERNSPTGPAQAPDSARIDLTTLIERIAKQDQEALAHLYDATRRHVFGLLIKILDDVSVAEEVLMDVYLQIWRQASCYDLNRGAPQAWITTIARSRAIDRFRSGKHELRLRNPLDESISASVSDGTDMVLESDRKKFVGRAMALLPEDQRVVIELAYFQGLSQAEIALSLSQPLGTVKTRTRLGMAKLREKLQPLMEGAF